MNLPEPWELDSISGADLDALTARVVGYLDRLFTVRVRVQDAERLAALRADHLAELDHLTRRGWVIL